MNTFFALYLWLMQTLGITGPVVLPNAEDAVQQKNPHTLNAPVPPPPQYTANSDRDVSTFISNGF